MIRLLLKVRTQDQMFFSHRFYKLFVIYRRRLSDECIIHVSGVLFMNSKGALDDKPVPRVTKQVTQCLLYVCIRNFIQRVRTLRPKVINAIMHFSSLFLFI